MSRFLIRFNTKHEEDPQGRKWRVLENGDERLALKIEIICPCETITEDVAPGVTKHHMLCYGKSRWRGDFVTIFPDGPCEDLLA